MAVYSLARMAEYWDHTAGRYLELYRDEFQSKPYDLDVLATFAASLPRGGRVCDAGCGPCGHVARILAGHGLRVTGIDISPRCVALARTEEPDLEFLVMDMARMEFDDGTFDGLVAYYAIHYQPKSTLPAAWREFARVLRPGGRMLMVAKQGEGEGWIEDPLGSGESVYWCSFRAAELEALGAEHGFAAVRSAVREPIAGEAQVPRIYCTAERAGAAGRRVSGPGDRH